MSAAIQLDPGILPQDDFAPVSLCCPACGKAVTPSGALDDRDRCVFECHGCRFEIEKLDGIWRALRPGRATEIQAPLLAYEKVRTLEGRCSEDPRFYLSLPWQDTSGLFAWQWKIRARSFAYLLAKMIPQQISRSKSRRLRILDLGAGNCWMSYRLALAGHAPVAVDISVNPGDGLGAAKHFQSRLEPMFPRFQAEMDYLPFGAGHFHLAIFNASFHYSQDYRRTIHEAMRVLVANGAILIVDSPTYRRETDGQAMTQENSAEFLRRFGSDEGTMDGRQYLTPKRLTDLESLGIRWTRYSPWYGWRWALRPLLARLAGRRVPSHFHIYLGLPVSDR
jgi:ubiquinone/menaquinone biosynthesis C-methylase UbiE